MNIAEFSIRNKVISWLVVVLLAVGGALSFTKLGQLEMPEFTIKNALVITQYPGASADQVEEEVTLGLEDAIQQMPQLKHVTSINAAGVSQIEVQMKDSFDKTELPQVWDELRRRVSDASQALPAGAYAPIVIDDFSDVYGYMLTLSGDGFSNRELSNQADYLRRELVLIPGIKKIAVEGKIQEQVMVEFSQQKLVAMGLSPDYLYGLLQTQNGVSNAGKALLNGNRIRLHPTGEFTDINDLQRVIVSPPGSTELVYLGDIAKVYKADTDTPQTMFHSQGKPALSIGISFMSGVNVVEVSQAITTKITELNHFMPVGMELTSLYNQGAVVDVAVSGFLVNLACSVVIVIAVLLLTMGLRSGVLMGAVLLITILGTFIGMRVLGIQLQSISLGALIIALGMLVDNAIVVTDGILVGIRKGLTRLEAAKTIVNQTQWPLLGATAIAIIAFAPIGLSDDASGEFCGSLFTILLLSLSISWLTAISITPFFCHMLFKNQENGAASELYQGVGFRLYRGLLDAAIHHRAITILVVIALMGSAMFGMGKVKKVFFPQSATPIYMVDIWMPEGTDVLRTQQFVNNIEQHLLDREAQRPSGMVNLTSVVGQGAQRFVLEYVPEKSYAAYGQLLVEMDSLDNMGAHMAAVQGWLRSDYPEAEYRVKTLQNGPSPAAKIEARFYGDDPQVLRALAAQAELVLEHEPLADNIRHNWRNQTLMVRPQLNLSDARSAGVSKQDLDAALLRNFSGQTVGVYRDGSHQLPIVARSPLEERLGLDGIDKLQVWSSSNNTYVPVRQVVSAFQSEWENPIIMRRDRRRVITVMADPALEQGATSDALLVKIRDQIEAIDLPAGYQLEWGGEYEMSTEADAGVQSSVPFGFLAMFVITVLLFNSVRQAAAIWICVPLSMVGVAAGLLLFDAALSFMAILGILSLSGMVIKNGIVLVDQINVEQGLGKSPYQAVIDSAVSRVRPVVMAALTTMLGMLPLLSDAFFQSLSVVIFFGLGFATLLTLVILPVCYSLFFRIKVKPAL
ncbi:efflux RND transporter permease subunit [Ferrimonas lipolytica]|uniref:Efflux RND transporter permease subunit n=1 Tax=Ferrimonas lipolytica TaxID=2724191 RepID=A0A6H1UEJ8_9GAMM|nr:efflux RND transporter permease subunit [Ferrimonas lipolytica]QIZ76636.1 efflux RND transporter permease subunit [Ferrimonas lipolytica]